MGIKTIEEAIALPEVDFIDLLGTPLMGEGFQGDDICSFVDTDGIAKTIELTPNGYVKVAL